MPKFLIIRFSSIGDIILTTPIIRCLKEQVKDAEIHFLTKKTHHHIVENNTYIDKCYFFDKSLIKIIPLLKKEKYDYIIDLHNNIRSRRASFKLNQKTFRFDKLNIKKWLLVNFKINLLPDEHLVDRYFRSVQSFGVVNDGKGLDYFIPEKDIVSMESLPLSHRNGYVGMVIGATYSTKRLPVKKLISICKKIDKPIVLLGWKGDEGYGYQIWEDLGDKVYNACGKFNLNQSASLVQQADIIMTHDTGLMHVAAAFNKRTISIWGNTVPEFGMTPYMNKELFSVIEVEGLSCRPCSKIGFQRCPKGHFKCMHLIDEERIVGEISQWENQLNPVKQSL